MRSYFQAAADSAAGAGTAWDRMWWVEDSRVSVTQSRWQPAGYHAHGALKSPAHSLRRPDGQSDCDTTVSHTFNVPQTVTMTPKEQGKGFPYSLPSVGVQAVSPQVTISHPPHGRLPLLSVRPAVTFPATEHHRPLAGTKLYCLVTEAHRCEQLAQGCYAAFAPSGFEPRTCWS